MSIKVDEEVGRSATMSYNEKKGDSRAFKKMVNRWRKLNGLDPLYKEKIPNRQQSIRGHK